MSQNDPYIPLFSEDELINPFGKVAAQWIFDTEQLEAYQDSMLKYQEFTVKITTDKVERRIILALRYEEGIVLIPPGNGQGVSGK